MFFLHFSFCAPEGRRGSRPQARAGQACVCGHTKGLSARPLETFGACDWGRGRKTPSGSTGMSSAATYGSATDDPVHPSRESFAPIATMCMRRKNGGNGRRTVRLYSNNIHTEDKQRNTKRVFHNSAATMCIREKKHEMHNVSFIPIATMYMRKKKWGKRKNRTFRNLFTYHCPMISLPCKTEIFTHRLNTNRRGAAGVARWMDGLVGRATEGSSGRLSRAPRATPAV